MRLRGHADILRRSVPRPHSFASVPAAELRGGNGSSGALMKEHVLPVPLAVDGPQSQGDFVWNPPPPPPSSLRPASTTPSSPEPDREAVQRVVKTLWALAKDDASPSEALGLGLSSLLAGSDLSYRDVVPALLEICCKERPALVSAVWDQLALSDEDLSNLCHSLGVAGRFLRSQQWKKAAKTLRSKADVVRTEDVLEVMRCGSDVPASLVDVMRTKACAILEEPWSNSATPHEVILAVQLCGPLAALTSLWSRVEQLHGELAFSIEHITTIFSECARVKHLEAVPQLRRQRFDSVGLGIQIGTPKIPPLGTRVVQLFSDHVCQKIGSLTPAQITTFVVALTSTSLPMDEFWLFMLAKRVQESASEFSSDQIVAIARCYAIKRLEDDAFFEKLSISVRERHRDFTPSQLADFLFSCALIRYLDEELCKIVLSPLHDLAKSRQFGTSLGAAVCAAGLLDQRVFGMTGAFRALSHGGRLEREVLVNMSQALLAIPRGVEQFMPQLLREMCLQVAARRSRRLFERRLVLIGNACVCGVPRVKQWSPRLMNQLALSLGTLQIDERNYEPPSSSFHMEVVAVLRFLDVKHHLEVPVRPFCLDIELEPGQVAAAEVKTAGEVPNFAVDTACEVPHFAVNDNLRVA